MVGVLVTDRVGVGVALVILKLAVVNPVVVAKPAVAGQLIPDPE